NDIAVITLSTGQGFAIVDADDFDSVKRYSWSKSNNGYVRSTVKRGGKQRNFTLHRLLLNPPSNLEVDHVNGYRIDNTRRNLRLCTRSQNTCHRTKLNGSNRSGVNGVFWSSDRARWVAMIHVNGKAKFIGRFRIIELAARARREAAAR